MRLDTVAGATMEFGGHRTLIPGQPGESELVSRIESDDPDSVMPSRDSGGKLSDAERKLL
ncbi:MAG: hypothetical protein HQ518_19610 [Rhodopirellula sp.]|nr:hypothetical protein [Rhodopirellula sp.]